MIEAIGELSMELKTEELYTAYSLALTKRAMETQAAAAGDLLAEMLPQTTYSIPTITPPAVSEAQFIDTYA